MTLQDGVLPLVAVPFGKQGQAMDLIRTATGSAPAPTVRPSELQGPELLGAELVAAESARLPKKAINASAAVQLNGQVAPYQWGINGAKFGDNEPNMVSKGQRVGLDLTNATMMTHPLHIHGHTFGLVGSGLRKDTVLLPPMASLPVELEADNAGGWAAHCHNIYHAEAGMMIAMKYRSVAP